MRGAMGQDTENMKAEQRRPGMSKRGFLLATAGYDYTARIFTTPANASAFWEGSLNLYR